MRNFSKSCIMFLIRSRFGLKKYEPFQFENQKSDAYYFFTDDSVMKYTRGRTKKSHVGINWLIDDGCKIIKKGKLKDLP